MSKTKTAGADAAGAPGDEAATVRARVLYAGAFGPIDSVVTVTAEEAAAGLAAGELDPDPAAVAYAEQLAAGTAPQ